MRLMTLAALSLYAVAHQEPSLNVDRKLVYSISNYQNQEFLLLCNVLSPTGEKEEERIEESIPSGRLELFATQSLQDNCQSSAIVMCKIKKDKTEPSTANIRLSIPCDTIHSQCALELSLSKDNHLKGFYACRFKSSSSFSAKKVVFFQKNDLSSKLWHRVIKYP